MVGTKGASKPAKPSAVKSVAEYVTAARSELANAHSEAVSSVRQCFECCRTWYNEGVDEQEAQGRLRSLPREDCSR